MTELCDLCTGAFQVGDLVFVYFTPSTGTLDQAKREPSRYFWAQDPEWGACQMCHRWLQQYETGEITRKVWLTAQTKRSIRNQALQEGVPERAPQDLMRLWLSTHVPFTSGVLENFLNHKIPEFREEIQASA